MIKLDTIIAVKDLEVNAKWYEEVFGFKASGTHLVRLKDEMGNIVLCLHPWEMDEHPTMMNPEITTGNGLILYFKTDNLESIYRKIHEMRIPLEEELHNNPNAQKKEFSLRDPDKYFLIITEYHSYDD